MKSIIFNNVEIYISKNGRIFIDGEELHQSDNGKGYKYASINSKSYQVHRLVAIAYLPNPQDKPEVNHKDFNKWNNYFDNLEWSTEKENILHAYEHFKLRVPKNVRFKESEILDIYNSNLPVKNIAEKYKTTEVHIRNIKNGRRWADITGAPVKPINNINKLDKAIVLEIYNSVGSCIDVANKYNTTPSIVSSIRNGYKYSQITRGMKNKLQ